jgi:hypothetical protein
MLTVFLLAINMCITVFGVPLVGTTLQTADSEKGMGITQDDVDAAATAGSNAVKSGDPWTETPGFIASAVTGVMKLMGTVVFLVFGYTIILDQILPGELSHIADIISIILMAVQLVTVSYLVINLISAIRGGGAT